MPPKPETRNPKPLLRGGQGHSAEDVEAATIAGGISFLGILLLIVFAVFQRGCIGG